MNSYAPYRSRMTSFGLFFHLSIVFYNNSQMTVVTMRGYESPKIEDLPAQELFFSFNRLNTEKIIFECICDYRM